MRVRGQGRWLGRLVSLVGLVGVGLAAPLWLGAAGVSAQAQPKLTCNSSVDWQIKWVATNVAPAPVMFPFDATAGQIASVQFTTRGPLWYNDHLSAQVYDPKGTLIWPDFNGYYLLTQTGSYSVGVYGFVNNTINEGTTVAQNTVMPFTVGLRCTAPPATPTPAPTPPPAPTPTATPETEE